MNSSYLILLFGAIACFVQSANSIQCYKCMANVNDPDCNNKNEVNCDVFGPPEFIMNRIQRGNNIPTTIFATGCMKKVYETRTYGQQKQKLIERNCFYGDLRNQTLGCLTDPNQYNIQMSCHVCDSDRCNSSMTILPTAITIFLVLSMAFLGKLFIY